MDENKTWSELSNDLEELTKNIKSKIQDEYVDDLKESLSNTINSTSELIKSIVISVEASIKDEAIKKEARKLVTNLAEELKITVENIGAQVKKVYPNKNNLEEE